jgi:hypothetical protein
MSSNASMRSALLILTALTFCLTASSARADRRQASYTTLTQARASSDGQILTVEVTIDARSWKFVRDNRIEPILQLWVGSREQPVDLRLRGPHDTQKVQLPAGEGGWSQVRMRIAGGGPRHELSWMVLGGVELTMLTLKVTGTQPVVAAPMPLPPGPGPERGHGRGQGPGQGLNRAGDPGVIKACGDVMSGSTDQQACLDAVQPYRWDPTPMLRACYKTMSGDVNTLACIRAAASLPMSAVATLDACYQAMSGNTNTLSCLGSAARARYEPSAAIGACYRAMSGNTDALTCIGYAAAAPSDPSPTIRACDQSMSGDTAVLGCIARAVGR